MAASEISGAPEAEAEAGALPGSEVEYAPGAIVIFDALRVDRTEALVAISFSI
jgi:hypothetical protein